ncbi:MAG: DNA-processing protein DprA [Candidatus Moranbacteria bacterium]|nr:DNA-processing protein DprA [Candidatus Moranbacteria bacterium]
MSQEEYIYLHALRSLPLFGDKSLRKVIATFGSARDAWLAKEFPSSLELAPKPKESFAKRHTYNPSPEVAYQKLSADGIRLLTIHDSSYPRLLKEIPDHPYLLYVRGQFDWHELDHKPSIAIVGSRKFTAYGEQVALRLAYDLSQAGFIVISGLAFGIDKKAHTGALDAKGITLAVLGGGIDNQSIAPRSNYTLAQSILTKGALISEHPPGTTILPAYFALRNRIIAGMCHGTLVIEAAEGSGSLITATLALDYNREVFAIPGSIFSPSSNGTHMLLKHGAKLVTHARDIIEEIAPERISKPKNAPTQKRDLSGLSPQVQKIYRALSHEPTHLNTITRATGLSIGEVQSGLTLLELQGFVKNIGAMQYIRTPL